MDILKERKEVEEEKKKERETERWEKAPRKERKR